MPGTCIGHRQLTSYSRLCGRTVQWRSIFAVHTWIVVKEQDAPSYSRYDYTAWGEPDDLAEEIIENLEAGLNSFREVLAGLNKVA